MKGLIIGCFLVFTFSLKGYSCLCYNPDFPLKYLSPSDTLPNKQKYIIKGKILNRLDKFYMRYGEGLAYNALVLEYWPNTLNLPDTITLIEDDPHCANTFEKDSTYLIGAFSMYRYLGVSPCVGAGLFTDYKSDIIALGPGKKNEVVLGKVARNDSNSLDEKVFEKKGFTIALYILLGISILTNLFFLLRRNKIF